MGAYHWIYWHRWLRVRTTPSLFEVWGVILAHEGVEEAEANLRKAYPGGAITAATLNAMTATNEDIDDLIHQLDHCVVTILINDVGGIPVDYPHFREFSKNEASGIDNHFNLIARFMAQLTQAMLPKLSKNVQPRALILNVTSA